MLRAPSRIPSPFAGASPHPLAQQAAEALMIELAARGPAREGKMFGVLVVCGRAGALEVLRAFSGMFEGSWNVEGFSPPLFSLDAHDRFWPIGQAQLATLDQSLKALRDGELAATCSEEVALLEAQARARASLDDRHHTRRAARHCQRAQGNLSTALDDESRADAAERRRMIAAHREEHAPLLERKHELQRRAQALTAERFAASNLLLARYWQNYRVSNARGETRPLTSFYVGPPPGGAGDCAAPKLLNEAYARALTPIAFAEFWWGPPPLAGDRRQGSFYPACRGKCGPLLPFMLEGLDVDAAPQLGAAPIAAHEPRVVFEDEWLTIVDKPCGLLSVAGRHASLADCVEARLGQRVVHRLDLDTSGLLIAVKDSETHAMMSSAFARREIDKRYVAWLDGDVEGDQGVIELALRSDVDDRPRQIHDPVYGKYARTEWSVIARSGTRTQVALVPRTGRTHQLRVHCAHPAGLGVAIVGDRLYGREDKRLLLHAEALSFTHPRTSRRVELVCPAPF